MELPVWLRWLRYVTVEPAAFLYIIGFEMYGVIAVTGIYNAICLQQYGNQADVDCSSPDKSTDSSLQTETTRWNILMSLAGFIPAIVSNLIFGAYGDRHGRKTNILVGQLSTTLMVLTFTFIMAIVSIPIWTMLPLVFLCGILGGMMLAVTSFYAYLADRCTDFKSLTRRLAIVSVVQSLAGVIASLMASFLIKVISFAKVALIADVIIVLSFFVVLVTLKQVPPRKVGMEAVNAVPIVTIPVAENGAVPLEPAGLPLPPKQATGGELRILLRSAWLYLKVAVITLCKRRQGRFRTYIWVTLFAFLFMSMVQVGMFTVLSLYLIRQPLDWSPSQVASYSALLRFAEMFGTLVAPYLFQKIGLHETTMILISMASLIARLILFAVGSSIVMYIAAIVGCLSGLGYPMAKSLLAQLVPSTEVGQIYSGVTLTSNLSILFSLVVFNGVYYATADFFAGFVFVFIAALVVVAFAMMLFVHVDMKKSRQR